MYLTLFRGMSVKKIFFFSLREKTRTRRKMNEDIPVDIR